MDLFAFTLISIMLVAVPGPNVLVIVSTSLANGTVRGLQTVAGTSLAMAIQLFVAAAGTTSIVLALAEGLLWLKWIGVAYLIYLGVRSLVALRGPIDQPATGPSSFARGFWVSLTNPKTVLFFAAFLPQFVARDAAYLPQVAVLSLIFWCIAVTLDSCYAILSAKLGGKLSGARARKVQNGASGLLYLGAGATLAATKNG